MHWDRIEGGRKQLKRRARVRWGQRTDDDLEVVGGTRDQLVGKKDVVEKQLDERSRDSSDT